jgi:glycerol-3-phosphate acyltransferase PlsY
MVKFTLILLLSYLVGSIPTSIIVGKILKGIDIRNYGSGNAGGTNAIRVLGLAPGLFVIGFDICKGIFATLVISNIGTGSLPFEDATLIKILAGAAAILGHSYTIFAKFKGGKGVATASGVVISLYPFVLPYCAIIFAIVLFSTGIVSLSSILSAVSLPAFLFIMKSSTLKEVDISLLIASIIIPIFIIYTHRSNIGRLLKGEEKRFEKIALLRKKKR